MAPSASPPRVAIVLGAGGQVGQAFHAGVLSAIGEVTGWDPRRASLIVGTSAGSIAGAMLRAGFAASDLAARATGRPLSPEGAFLASRIGLGPPSAPRRPRPASRRVASVERLARAWRAPWAIRPGSMAAALLPEGQVPIEPLFGPFRALFAGGWPTEPLWTVAVDLDRGHRTVFGRHDSPPATVAEAVAASCAIPAFFAPVEIGGRRYVDGGVHSTTNADVLTALEAEELPDLVIVSAPMSMARGGGGGVETPIRRMVALGLGREVAGLRGRGIQTIAFQPGAAELDVMSGNALDPAKMPAVCERSRSAVLRRLARADERRRLAALG